MLLRRLVGHCGMAGQRMEAKSNLLHGQLDTRLQTMTL